MRIAGLISGAVVLVAVLLVAVFAAIQYIDSPTQATGPPGDPGEREPIRVMEIAVDRVIDKGDGPLSQAATVKIITMASAELPESPPDVSGVFLSMDGDVMRVGTGAIEAELEVTVVSGQAPVRKVTLSHNGPEVSRCC